MYVFLLKKIARLLVISSWQVFSAAFGSEVRRRIFAKARSFPFIQEDWKLIRRKYAIVSLLYHKSTQYDHTLCGVSSFHQTCEKLIDGSAPVY